MTESGATSGISPKDTKWAVGTLANTNLTYGACPLEGPGGNPSGHIGTTYVVHLTNEDIFLTITLTAWGGEQGIGDKSFSYTRSTPSVAGPTPTVSITSPSAGAAFAAPATVSVTTSPSVSSGTVTNVQLFTNNVSFGSVTSSPFNFTANNLSVGTYNLTAVATAAGVLGTSAVVTITVANPPSANIISPANNSIFAAPATLSITSTATVSGSTVTNVQLFTNNVSFGSVTSSPFNFTANNLPAGGYALKTVATASGVSTTSSVVNITVSTPPTVSITNPVGGAVFAAPANLKLGASAIVSGGTVTNVQFFTNGISAGSVLVSPFNLTTGGAGAGAYSLSAVATASGVSTTSSVVSVSVVNPVSGNLSAATVNNGHFSFNYAANTGLSYVVQSSTNLPNWVSLATNVASGSSVPFSDSFNSNGFKLYRVGRLPNP